MINLTLEEMQVDLSNTESDIQALSDVVNGINRFMTITGGEDRSAFRMDRMKYETLLHKAYRLKDRIIECIADLNSQ